jgi:hypothetical protein
LLPVGDEDWSFMLAAWTVLGKQARPMVRVTLNRNTTLLLNDLHVPCKDCKHRRTALFDQAWPRIGAEDPEYWHLGVGDEVPVTEVQTQ